MQIVFSRKRKIFISVVRAGDTEWIGPIYGARVRQGSVLGPALFLIHINDIQDQVQSSLRLFAGDSVIYREIHCQEDHCKLQCDIATLTE